MKFADIIGHEELKCSLRRSVMDHRVSHAQLFAGGGGYGALAMAVAYVQYLNCPNRTADDSCGVCPTCLQTATLSHPDLHFVMPVNKMGKKSGEVVVSDNFMGQMRSLFGRTGGYITPDMWFDELDLGKTLQGVISVNEADEIIRKLSFKSYGAEYKTMIIWLPEMMNEQAANKILKILEEPMGKTLFVLVSQRSEKLLSTIISRTQRVDIPRVDVADMERYAESQGVSDTAQRRAISRVAAGDVIELRRLIKGADVSQRRENFEFFTSLMRLSYNNKHLELMGWAEDMAALSREQQRAVLHYSLQMVREAYIIHAGVGEISYLWGEEADFCKKFAPFIGNQNIEFLIEQIELALAQITQNGNPTIVFTHFALLVSKQINRL
ncbi:MAG: DNA polymerase III subunit delta [Rikenellaceae bacterium]